MKRFLSPAVILSVFLLDRLAKAWALKHLAWRSLQVLPFFHLTYAQNTGVAFGMFRDSNLFFLVFSTALVGGLLVFRRRIEAYGRLASLGLALVLGASDTAGDLAEAVNMQSVQAEQKGLITDMDLVSLKLKQTFKAK